MEYGKWSREIRENSSSNWRELGNLVEVVRRLLASGELEDTELFVFTDNSTAEAAFSKGASKSRKLFELILDLKELQTQYNFFLHIIHVSGKRMIAQGTDGLSRADKSTGVMAGKRMLDYIPLHLNAAERSPSLLKSLEGRLPKDRARILTPEDWFEHLTHPDIAVWLPPPAAADVVAEQLTKARHKRPHLMSVVIVPRLFTGRWRRKMTRCTDGNWTLKVAHVWNLKTFFEPLLLFVALPYRSDAPAFERRNALLEELGGILSSQDVSEEASSVRWDLLCQFLCRQRAVPGLS